MKEKLLQPLSKARLLPRYENKAPPKKPHIHEKAPRGLSTTRTEAQSYVGAQMNVRGFKQPFRTSYAHLASPSLPTESRHHGTRTPLTNLPNHENALRSLSTALRGTGGYMGTQTYSHGF